MAKNYTLTKSISKTLKLSGCSLNMRFYQQQISSLQQMNYKEGPESATIIQVAHKTTIAHLRASMSSKYFEKFSSLSKHPRKTVDTIFPIITQWVLRGSLVCCLSSNLAKIRIHPRYSECPPYLQVYKKNGSIAIKKQWRN